MENTDCDCFLLRDQDEWRFISFEPDEICGTHHKKRTKQN